MHSSSVKMHRSACAAVTVQHRKAPMKISALKINSSAIEAGVWMDAPGLTGVQFRVRGLANADYRRLSGKLNDGVPRDKRVGGRVDPIEADRMLVTLIIETILLDWRGLTDDADAPLPYSRDVAEKLLADPDYRVLRESVLAAASMVGEQQAEDIEAAAKN